jgi:hypothetical protein
LHLFRRPMVNKSPDPWRAEHKLGGMTVWRRQGCLI